MAMTTEMPVWDPSEATDLRRRHRRDMVDRVLAAAAHLPDEDRLLVEAVYRDGRSVVDLATISGAEPRTLRRHIRRLIARVLSPRYAFVALHAPDWSPTRRRVASACVLAGRSLRAASADLSLSLHAVRRHHDAVNALYEATVFAGRPRAARAIGGRS